MIRLRVLMFLVLTSKWKIIETITPKATTIAVDCVIVDVLTFKCKHSLNFPAKYDINARKLITLFQPSQLGSFEQALNIHNWSQQKLQI